jgi:hypothetical protein
MSDLENKHAKPAMQDLIVSDSPVKLPPERIRSIMLFAFKAAVIGHAMDKNKSSMFPDRVFSPSNLRNFARHLIVPFGVQLWLGCLRVDDPRSGIFRMAYGKTPPGKSNGFKLYVFTFAIGRLIFQFLATQWTKARNRRLFVPIVTQAPMWNEMSIPVWPQDRGIVFDWPPREQIHPDLVDPFSQRISRFSDPV